MKTFMNTSSVKLQLAVVGFGVVVAACAQPPVECTVGRSVPYAAKYKLTAGEGNGPCAELKGDTIGMAAYNPATSQKRPNLAVAGTFAMSTSLMQVPTTTATSFGVVDEAPDHDPYSLATWKAVFPDDKGLCFPKGAIAGAVQDLPEVPASPADEFAGQAATSIHEEWTDVQFYVTATALGTQMSGHYKVTQDSCTAEYDVLAVYVAASCDDGTGQPNADLCSPEPIPSKGVIFGSGISPDFPTVCDADLLLCVLDAVPGTKVPVLKKKK